MEIIVGLHNLKARHRGGVVTIGSFDGVHHAHQMLLAMHAVKDAKDARQAGALAAAVARMHNCEAGWWYALHTNRHRPRKVLQALALLYA